MITTIILSNNNKRWDRHDESPAEFLLKTITLLLIAIGLPKTTVENLGSSVVHLLPAMEAAALAQRADGVRKSMVHLSFRRLRCCKLTWVLHKKKPRHIVEEHLVPAVLTTQHHGHHVVEHRPGTARILCEELVPRKTLPSKTFC